MPKYIGFRRKRIRWELNGDGRWDERLKGKDKRYWKRWKRRYWKSSEKGGRVLDARLNS